MRACVCAHFISLTTVIEEKKENKLGQGMFRKTDTSGYHSKTLCRKKHY
jgi:hypothetical protein